MLFEGVDKEVEKVEWVMGQGRGILLKWLAKSKRSKGRA